MSLDHKETVVKDWFAVQSCFLYLNSTQKYMNKIFWIGAIFIAATLLIENTPNAAKAYSCSTSVANGYSGHSVTATTGVSGSSGSCASGSSAFSVSGGKGGIGSASASGHTSAVGVVTGFSSSGGFGASLESASGGAQSSCSSSSVSNSGDAVISNTQSVSKSGTCP
ncbi:MAG TPA: hypothetical protein VFI73_00910 [Candidatus Nitrosopolaris sp.]|nr:hypothetical protein [Candidatus Nitrosopolaris sp.]